MNIYHPHIKQASDYKCTVGIEYLQQDDLRCQGGVGYNVGFDSR